MITLIHEGQTTTGMTNNFERRFKEHNSGKTPSNKKYAPFKLIYKEEVENSKIARQREKYFKGGMGRNWLKNKRKTV